MNLLNAALLAARPPACVRVSPAWMMKNKGRTGDETASLDQRDGGRTNGGQLIVRTCRDKQPQMDFETRAMWTYH